ncbi:MAG: hypothetical protein ACD_2C00263G0009 [uncultured bacterium (gcode 4)]|uniref:Uncharacterized protein n=1 Tax=uncultured bacterium (gcode 4) TaxID=1234023 RepID=K2G135_9BACT|nr:MAG: hypothetical protein ACD_2C00263G0009 [uncultured bacterium (gcode 4)]
MRNYILHDIATERILKSWLWEKIRERVRQDEYSLPSPYWWERTNDDDYMRIKKRLDEEWYFRWVTDSMRYLYQQTINSIFQNPSAKSWKVERETWIRTLECDKTEILHFCWLLSSEVLSPTEIWLPEKYWFRNPTDLIGCVSVYIKSVLEKNPTADWYEWTTRDDNWKRFTTKLSATIDGDIRIKRIEKTPFETFDPFWNEVNLRPETAEDVQEVKAYHSIEIYLMMTILKWMDTVWIKSELLREDWEKIQEFLSWFSTVTPFAKKYTENYMWFDNIADNPKAIFQSYHLAMKDFRSLDKRTHFGISTADRWRHLAYIWDSWELIFSHIGTGMSYGKMEKDMVFHRKDADELLKWIIYLTKTGKCRTGIDKVLNAMIYYIENREKLLTGKA